MANVYLQQGDVKTLDEIVASGDVWVGLHLFKNNHVPDVTDVNGDYTEANFSGYAAISALSFGAAFVNPDGKGEVDASPESFTHNGGGTSNTIYGAYVTDDGGDVVYAERFGAPISMASNGDLITYTARVTAVSA